MPPKTKAGRSKSPVKKTKDTKKTTAGQDDSDDEDLIASKTTAALSKATTGKLSNNKNEQKPKRAARKAPKKTTFNEGDFLEDSEEIKKVIDDLELDVREEVKEVPKDKIREESDEEN